MEHAWCSDCGCGFQRDAAWKTQCRTCWEATHEQAQCQRCGELFWRDAAWKKVCFRCFKGNNSSGYRRSEPPPQQPPPQSPADAIPPHVLRALIHLCHPDKHNNSDTATRITQWLLDQRNRK